MVAPIHLVYSVLPCYSSLKALSEVKSQTPVSQTRGGQDAAGRKGQRRRLELGVLGSGTLGAVEAHFCSLLGSQNAPYKVSSSPPIICTTDAVDRCHLHVTRAPMTQGAHPAWILCNSKCGSLQQQEHLVLLKFKILFQAWLAKNLSLTNTQGCLLCRQTKGHGICTPCTFQPPMSCGSS